MNRILTKGELHNGAEYIGASRLALSARWDASIEKFKFMLFKYGYFFIEEIQHPEDAPPEVDSFKPYMALSEAIEQLSQGR
jgi:hypothetical protein